MSILHGAACLLICQSRYLQRCLCHTSFSERGTGCRCKLCSLFTAAHLHNCVVRILKTCYCVFRHSTSRAWLIKPDRICSSCCCCCLHRNQARARCMLYAAGRLLPRIRQLVCTSQQRGRPDISLLAPALQEQWDHAANASLGFGVVKPGSGKHAAWVCDQCPDGHLHQWTARIHDRTRGIGCPQCSGRKVCQHSSLATKAPGLAAEWDLVANADIGVPESISAQTHKPVTWRCLELGHRWVATPNQRVRSKSGCPDCAKLSRPPYSKQPTFFASHHELLKEWDHTHNAAQDYFPDEVTLGSHKPIHWLCNKCPAGQPHSWTARPSGRTKKRNATGCPFCAGRAACKCNSLEALYPSIAAEWDYTKNTGQPSEYPAGSVYEAWWLRPDGKSWKVHIYSRTKWARRKEVEHRA